MTLLTKQRLNTYFKILFYTSLAFLMIFLIYGFKTMGDETCSTNVISNEPTTNSKNIVDTDVHTFFVDIPKNKRQNIEQTDVCLNIVGNSEDYNTVSLMGKNVYVNNETSDFTCSENVVLTDKIYFNCVDCNSTQNIKVYRSSEEALHIDGSIGVIPIAQYKIYLLENCREFFKTLLQVYLVVISLIFFIFVLLGAIKWFEGWIFKW